MSYGCSTTGWRRWILSVDYRSQLKTVKYYSRAMSCVEWSRSVTVNAVGSIGVRGIVDPGQRSQEKVSVTIDLMAGPIFFVLERRLAVFVVLRTRMLK